MKRAFPNGGEIFQQDLATCNTAKKVKKVFEENRIKILDWPGNLSDMNSIENLWRIEKKKGLYNPNEAHKRYYIIDVWY